MFFFLIFCFFSLMASDTSLLKIKCDKNFVEVDEKYIPYELLILLDVGAQMNTLDNSIKYSFSGDEKELYQMMKSYKNLNSAQSHINIINYLCVVEPQLERFENYIKNHATALINIIKKQKLDPKIIENIDHEKIRNKIKLSFVSMEDLKYTLMDYSHRLELTVDEISDTLLCEKFLIITQDEDIMYHQTYKTSIYDLSCKKIIKKFFHKNKKLFFNNDKKKVIGEQDITVKKTEQIIIDLDTLKNTFFIHEHEELLDIIGDICVIRKMADQVPVISFRKNDMELFPISGGVYKNRNKKNDKSRNPHENDIVFLQNNILYIIQKACHNFFYECKTKIDQSLGLLESYEKIHTGSRHKTCCSLILNEKRNYQGLEVQTYCINHKISLELLPVKTVKPLATIPFGYDLHLVFGRECISVLKENNDLCRIRNYKNHSSITEVYNSGSTIIKSFYHYGENLYHIDLNDIYQPTEEMLLRNEKNRLERNKIYKERKKQKLERKSTTSPNSNNSQKIKIPISIPWVASIYLCHLCLAGYNYSFDVIRRSDNVVVDSVTFSLRSIALITFWGLLIIFRIWEEFWFDREEKQFTTLFRSIDDCFSCKQGQYEEKFHYFFNHFSSYVRNLEKNEKIDKPHCNQCQMNLLSSAVVFAVVGVENGYVTKKNSVELFKKLAYFMVENSLINYKPIHIYRFDHWTRSHLKENSYSGFNSEKSVKTPFLKYAKKLFDTKADYKEFKNNIISKSNRNTKGALCWKF